MALLISYGDSCKNHEYSCMIGLGEALKEEYDGKVAIVDGVDGKVYIDPDEETMASMQKSRRKIRNRKNF